MMFPVRQFSLSTKFIHPSTASPVLHHRLPTFIHSYTYIAASSMCTNHTISFSCGHYPQSIKIEPCTLAEASKKCTVTIVKGENIANLCIGCNRLVLDAGDKVRRKFASI
jgi:hypothetical protein